MANLDSARGQIACLLKPLLWIGAVFWLAVSWPPTNALFSGAHANIQARRDSTVTASAALADQDVAVSAGRNIALDAADINFGGTTQPYVPTAFPVGPRRTQP